jgi:hypothetical protein
MAEMPPLKRGEKRKP